MARRGWVSAEVAPGTWRRLQVFDDGWVELPGLARSLSDTRRNLRGALTAVGVFLGAFLVGRALDGAGAPTWTVVVTSLVSLGALVYGGYLATRAQFRNVQQTSADAAQARAERAAGQRLQLAPGAPRWRRAESAAQMHGWLVGVPLVAAADVVDVVTGAEPDRPGTHRAVVTLRDGTQRTYRSPDAKVSSLLGAFGPA